MLNVMAALPNIGGAVCSTPQSLADVQCQSACSSAAKTRNPLKFAGVSQTPEPISAVSGPKSTILSGHVEEVLVLNNFFPIVHTYEFLIIALLFLSLAVEALQGKTCQNTLPSGEGRSLGANISREVVAPLPIY